MMFDRQIHIKGILAECIYIYMFEIRSTNSIAGVTVKSKHLLSTASVYGLWHAFE